MVRRSIFLELHYERADGVERWWAYSPDIPGLSVAADTRQGLLDRAHAAILEIIAQEEDMLTLTWTEHHHPQPSDGQEVEGR